MKILIPSIFLITMCLLLGACAVLPSPDSGLEESTPTMADLSTNPGPAAVIELLAGQQNIAPEQIGVVSTVPYDWADTCLGLSQPGETCATKVVPGYRVELKVGDAIYIFRTDVAGNIIRQEKEGQDGTISPPSPTIWGEMARQLGVDPKEVNVISSEAVNWPDACIGISGPGDTCAQVITPGFRYIVEVNGQTVEFRTNQDGTTVRKADAPGSTPAR